MEHNAKVYMGARDEKKARAAIEELKQKKLGLETSSVPNVVAVA